MFNSPSIKLGTIFGIPFEVNWSWILIFALVAFTLATGYYPSVPGAQGAAEWVFVLLGTVTALLFFASIVAHELSHSLVTRAQGGRVSKITLFIFGGVASIEEEPSSAGKEFLMAAAGPAMSLLIAAVGGGLFLLLATRGAPWWLTSPISYLAFINAFVGVFNLLPGFPLDGGRVLRSILWALTGNLLKATRWATRSGQIIGWGMVAFALWGVVVGRQTGIDPIWLGLIGWFIAWLAGASYRQQELMSRMTGVTVADMMTHSPEYVDGSISVEQLAHDHFLGGQHSRYPVMLDGMIIGLISLPDVRAVPREQWPLTRVADVTNRDLARVSVQASDPAGSVVPRIAGDAPGALLVVGEGRLVGILTRADVLSFLQAHPV